MLKQTVTTVKMGKQPAVAQQLTPQKSGWLGRTL
jgi:hypothetical protein